MDLQQWLRDASPDERERVATAVQTSVAYLYQLAGGHRRPGIDLAKRLASETGVPRAALRPDVWGDVEHEPSAA